MALHADAPQYPIDLWAALAIRKSLAGRSSVLVLARAGDNALATLARRMAVADPDERCALFENGINLYPLDIGARIYFAVQYQDPLLTVPVLPPGFGPGYDPSFQRSGDLPPGPPLPVEPADSFSSKSEIQNLKSKIQDPLPLPGVPALTPEQAGGHAIDACPWLNDYVAFSRAWSPRAYDGFHEACGLWLLSTVAARRVVLHMSKDYYTPLFIALVARTSLYCKSTTTRIAQQTLKAAGLDWLLAPDDSTPQRFIHDLTLRLPDDYDALSPERQARIGLRLALSAQRGWYYEEFGQQLAAMGRDTGGASDFRSMLRRFDDCPESYEYATLGRGSDVVERPYLALLANMTPADMQPLSKVGAPLWNDGFWARFAFVSPPPDIELKQGQFPDGDRIIPPALFQPLRAWHERLGMPQLVITDVRDDTPRDTPRGQPTSRKRVQAPPCAPHACTLAQGVKAAFYAYHDALQQLIAQSNDMDLDGNYARFAEKALRIAILAASLGNDDHVELRHWHLGQRITEGWRANLHALFGVLNAPEGLAERTPNVQLEERVLHILRKHPGLTAARVTCFVRNLNTARAQEILDNLVEAGLITYSRTGNSTRYEVS